MEDILKKIIEIDNNAKSIVKEEKNKKLNIENVIEESFNTTKVVIDLEYKDEINKKKEEKQLQLEEKKREINNNLQLELNKIKNDYNENEKNIIASIVNSIKNEEN